MVILERTDPIDALGISERQHRVLTKAGIITVDDLVKLPVSQWKKIEGIGNKSVDQLMRIMDDVSFETEGGDPVKAMPAMRASQMSKKELLKMYAQKYAKEPISCQEFCDLYNHEIDSMGLSGHKGLTINSRSYENTLHDCEFALWGYNRKFRYYDIGARDYTKLIGELDLPSYANTIFSSRLLFLKHPDLMDEYDLWDEYELHNLLKKIYDKMSPHDTCVRFGRMPTIQVGEASYEEQMLRMIQDNMGLAHAEIARMYSEKYGVQLLVAVSLTTKVATALKKGL